MVGRNGVLLWAGLAVLGAGCAGPKPVPAVVDRGKLIDPALLEGFRRGVTTREEAVAALGEPTAEAVDPATGTRLLTWDYRHADAHTSIAVTTALTFDPDGRLLTKFVNRDVQSR